MGQKRRVPPEVYDREYLLSDNTEGYEEFQSGSLSYVKQLQLDMLDLETGTTLLEVGIGRGEFLRHCAERGAAVSGIDYSEAALEIARSTLQEFPEADLRVADCKELPFEADSFDRVYAGDVLEHQDIEDGAVMLREMHRVLRPGGFLLVHTAPNSVFMKLVYPIARPLLKRIDERSVEVDGRMHVEDLNDAAGLALSEDDDYDTVAGFVFSELGYIPPVGEKLTTGGATFTVLAADDRRIIRLKVEDLSRRK